MGKSPTQKVRRLPPWLKKRIPRTDASKVVRELLRDLHLNTVCQSAKCPNLMECFAKHRATFMILGARCTRRCTFCAVDKGTPDPVDPSEPERVAEAVARLKLRHAVITSVTRDDLSDGGSEQFRKVIVEIRKRSTCRIEVLTPDFLGNTDDVARVVDAAPDIYNHNVETVPRLYPNVRPQADYRRSLELLRFVKQRRPDAVTKSGIMVGLGETRDEILRALRDLQEVGCDIVTIGQYLSPSPAHHPVVRFVPPEEFEELQAEAQSLGFRAVAAGPFVRSSYCAEEVFESLDPSSPV